MTIGPVRTDATPPPPSTAPSAVIAFVAERMAAVLWSMA